MVPAKQQQGAPRVKRETGAMAKGETDMGVLSGVRVIDLTRVLGGPFCTQWLGDHGAEIIKVEPPQGDETRGWGPPFGDEDMGGAASYFIGVNRNKRGMSLDLSKPEARDALLRLLETADVLIENFKPGGMEKFGLGYEEVLKPRLPRLIHCRISGFGADGPWGGLPGYDAIVQAMSGLMSVNGAAGEGGMRLGIPLVDLGVGLSTAFAVAGALYERERSGEGQYVDMTLNDCAISLLFPHGANFQLSGTRPEPMGNEHPNLAPYDKFATRTVDLFIGVGNDRQFAALCRVLGAPELAEDSRFARNAARTSNREALSAALAPRLAELEGEAASLDLMKAGVPAGPVMGAPEVLSHEHTKHRGMVLEDGPYRGVANPVKYGRTPAAMTKRPPRFGEDTRAILGEAGYSESEIDALIDSGAALAERRDG